MSMELILWVLVISFLVEYMDATLGMGYGTALAPVLLLMGFSPLQVVPAILLAQFATGVFAAFLHQRVGNVFFDFNNDRENKMVKRFRIGYIPRSKDSKVALMLTLCSIAGVIIAVVVALNLPAYYLKLYIGVVVTIMGVLVITKHRSERRFSWKRIMGIGTIASFNKGMSGGGYGPLIISAQILSGINTKNSIGIAALAEAFACFVGVLVYFFFGSGVEWVLAPYLVIGSLISVPLSVYTVKKAPTRQFTLVIGIATALLGILTLIRL